MGKTKKTILSEYVEFRSLKNKTSNSLSDIEYQIKNFINHSKKALDDFTEEMLIKYVSKINKKYKTNTANTIKSSFLKNFIKWYYLDWSSRFRQLDRICSTEKPDPTYTPEQMLTEEDVKKLIQKEEKVFWKAFFLTLFYGGCRPVEVINLKWVDIEFEEDGAFFTIYSQKNKENFLKFIPSDVSFYIQQLPKTSDYVFCNSTTKKPVTIKGAYWRIRKLSNDVLGKKINLYLLRHSIATINYNKDDIKDSDIARQMGHSQSQKNTYVHNDKSKLKQKAKRIYIKPEELPREQRHKLEKQVSILEEEREETEKRLKEIESMIKIFVENSEKELDRIKK